MASGYTTEEQRRIHAGLEAGTVAPRSDLLLQRSKRWQRRSCWWTTRPPCARWRASPCAAPATRRFEASNGKEGLALLDGSKLNLIVSDVNMPVMNGIEFPT